MRDPAATGTDARVLIVLDPGLLTTVQDLGRRGWAHLGVPRSGALDEPGHRLANRLVGNAESAATLETTATGLVLRPSGDVVVAVTGASCAVLVDGRPVAWGSPVRVPAGAVLALGPARHGLRCYLAVAGGIAVPPVLGSRSTDLLGGLGPAPLTAGTVLPLGDPGAVPPAPDVVLGPRRGDVVRVLPGPRAGWTDLPVLDGARFEVGEASNRIGLRLRGAALPRRSGEVAPEPMVLGAVQLPPDGQPVVLLHDHATTGGYPVVAVVRRADLPLCAQLRPGDRVTLRVARR